MSVETVPSLDDAHAIRARNTRMVIWPRERPPFIADWLDGLSPDRFPRGRFLVTPESIRPAMLEAASGRASEDVNLAWLIDDVAYLTQVFSRVLGGREVDVRLEVIRGDACWRFHYDHVPFRLVTTYRGPGTQWVHGGLAEEALSRQKEFTGPLNTLATGHVALFKGARSSSGGVVHRSPPLRGRADTRLFLCLNALSEVSPPLYQPQAGDRPMTLAG